MLVVGSLAVVLYSLVIAFRECQNFVGDCVVGVCVCRAECASRVYFPCRECSGSGVGLCSYRCASGW